MPLWESYQHCLAATDPTELFLIIEQFERVVSEGAEPPSWMKAWGDHVANQPLRTSVDPQALGAACTLRTAAVMAETEHLTEAQALYQRVRTRYSSRDFAYYAIKLERRWLAFKILLLLSPRFIPIVSCRTDSQHHRLL